eukprot:UN11326
MTESQLRLQQPTPQRLASKTFPLGTLRATTPFLIKSSDLIRQYLSVLANNDAHVGSFPTHFQPLKYTRLS